MARGLYEVLLLISGHDPRAIVADCPNDQGCLRDLLADFEYNFGTYQQMDTITSTGI